MKFPKLNLACGKDVLRPVYNYVMVTNDNIVCTDSHILIVLHPYDIVDLNFIDDVKLDKCFIHYTDWKKLTTNFETIEWWNDNLLITRKNGTKEVVFIHKDIPEGGTYPNWERVIPSKEGFRPIDKIGIDAKKLYNISQALPFIDNHLKLNFSSRTKAIHVEDANETYKSYGIIMPVTIKE